MSRRHLILTIALLAAMGLSAWALWGDNDELVQANVRPAPKAARKVVAAVPGPGDVSVPNPTEKAPADNTSGRNNSAVNTKTPAPASSPAQDSGAAANVFAAYNYKPKPNPAAVAAAAAAALQPPPAPRAPPLPFAFTGRLIINGETTYLLLQGDAPLEVRVGSNVGDFKLVEAGLDRLVFQHGPTGDRVPMAIAAPLVN